MIRQRLKNFRQKHLFDYTKKAEFLWFGVVIVGFSSLANSILNSFRSSFKPHDLVLICCWFSMSWVISRLTIRVSSERQIAVVLGDIISYLALLMHGPHIANITSSIEGYSGSKKTSKRLSSHLFSLALSCISMTLAGALMRPQWYDSTTTYFELLLLSVIVHWVVQTFTVFSLVRMKKNLPLTLKEWLQSSTEGGIVQVVSALFAGGLTILTKAIDASNLVSIALFILMSLVMMYFHLARSARDDLERGRLLDEIKKLKDERSVT